VAPSGTPASLAVQWVWLAHPSSAHLTLERRRLVMLLVLSLKVPPLRWALLTSVLLARLSDWLTRSL